MKTLVLRFADYFAPKDGTIREHEKVIEKYGYAWFGKKGNKISKEIISNFFFGNPIKIILTKNGTNERYLATVEDISFEKPDVYPSYYSEELKNMSTWFKITKFEPTNENILENCFIVSSGRNLSEIFKKTMGACFLVEIDENYLK